MEILVFGANGLLGSNVVYTGLDQGWSVTGTYHSSEPRFGIPLRQVDITNPDAVAAAIADWAPDWVVNCVAMTDVDGCEEHPDRAHEVNAVAPGRFAELCAEQGRGFLHVSTDYVFDGEASGLYSETAAVNPRQVYGKSKLAGEVAVRDAMPEALIVRLSFVYGVHRGTDELSGFPAWVRDHLQAGVEVPLFTDQHVTPSRAGHTAATVCDLIEDGASGLFHVACRSCVSPFEFGELLCREMGADDELLTRGKQRDVDRPAARPSQTCLDVSRVEDACGRAQPTLAEDLAALSDWFGASEGA